MSELTEQTEQAQISRTVAERARVHALTCDDTFYVHIMAYRTELEADEGLDTDVVHIDSMAYDDWLENKHTPESFTQSHTDIAYYCHWLEWD
jgi:hypothetical protein